MMVPMVAHEFGPRDIAGLQRAEAEALLRIPGLE